MDLQGTFIISMYLYFPILYILAILLFLSLEPTSTVDKSEMTR